MRLVRGLAAVDAARIVAARADHPFDSIDDMWRRASVSAASLVDLAEADPFLPSLDVQRRDAFGSSMMAINGRIQREGEVVHLIAQQLFDLSGDLSALADRDGEFKLPTGRGDEAYHTARSHV